MSALARIDAALGAVLRGVAGACFAGLFVLLFVNVAARTARLSGFAWFDEIVEGLFAWMVFIGAAALWRERDHFRVDWLEVSLPPAPARALRILTATLALVFLAVMTWYGATLTLRATALTPILDLPVALFYAAIPISGAVMCGYALADLAHLVRSPNPSTEGARR